VLCRYRTEQTSVSALLKPGSVKFDLLLSRTGTPQNEALCCILLRPKNFESDFLVKFFIAESGGPANWKRGI
jgi:hypothetical protein